MEGARFKGRLMSCIMYAARRNSNIQLPGGKERSERWDPPSRMGAQDSPRHSEGWEILVGLDPSHLPVHSSIPPSRRRMSIIYPTEAVHQHGPGYTHTHTSIISKWSEGNSPGLSPLLNSNANGGFLELSIPQPTAIIWNTFNQTKF